MKKILSLLAILINLSLGAQCPEGDLFITNQAALDQVLAAFPNCTELSGDLSIGLDEGENEPLILTGLSQLETINGRLSIGRLDYYDSELDSVIPGSLAGLEGLRDVSEIIIGGVNAPIYHIESLAPLNGIEGYVSLMYLQGVIFYDALPNFEGITNLNRFAMEACNGVSESPLFPNLNYMIQMRFEGAENVTDSLRTIHIPDLDEIYLSPISPINSGVFISNLPNLENVIGGPDLEKVGSVKIENCPSLTDVSAFDNVEEVSEELILRACSDDIFDSFRKLRHSMLVELEINTISQGCSNSLDFVDIKIGEEAETFYTDELVLEASSVDSLRVNAPLQRLGDLDIILDEVNSLTGFEELDTLKRLSGYSGYFYLVLGGMESYPNFNDLVYINRSLDFFFRDDATLTDMSLFGALNYVGKDLTLYGTDANETFTSLAGLENLTHVEELGISGFQSFNDLSAVLSIDTLAQLELYSLPSFSQEVEFEKFDSLITLWLYNMPITDLSQFGALRKLNNLELTNNSLLTSTSGLDEINQIKRLTFEDNPILSEIDLPFDLGVEYVRWRDNWQLSACAESPVICDIFSGLTPFDSNLQGNGNGCNNHNSILNNCVLSTDDFSSEEFKIWMLGSDHLQIESKVDLQVDLRIFNASGMAILSQNDIQLSRTKTISLPEMSTGVYLVELQSKSDRFVEKVMVP